MEKTDLEIDSVNNGVGLYQTYNHKPKATDRHSPALRKLINKTSQAPAVVRPRHTIISLATQVPLGVKINLATAKRDSSCE